MDIKKLITGGIAGGVVFFFLGWLVYGNLLSDFMRQNPGKIGWIDRKEPEFLYLIAGQLMYGFLLTYIMLKANVNSIVSGLITGAIIGFLMGAAIDFTMYGTTLVLSKKGLLAELSAGIVITALAGAVIAAATGRKMK